MNKQETQQNKTRNMVPRRTVARPKSSAEAMNFRDVTGLLRCRIWLIVVIVLISTLAMTGLWFWYLHFDPKYTSVGYVQCNMPTNRDIFQGTAILPQLTYFKLETENQAAYLNSENFLNQVLARTLVQQTTWKGKNELNLTKAMKKSFSAQPRRDTRLVEVKMQAGSPEEAQLILNEALLEYRGNRKFEARGGLEQTLIALNKELDEKIRPELVSKRGILRKLIREANVPGWEQGRSTIVTDRLNALNQEKLRLEALLQQTQVYGELQREERNNLGFSSQVQLAVEQDQMIVSLRHQVASLEQQYDTSLNRLGEEHREVKDIYSQIQTAQKQIESRQERLRGQYTQQENLEIVKEIDTLQKQLDRVNDQLSDVEERQKKVDRAREEYLATQDDIKILNQRIEMFNKQINTINVAINNADRQVENITLGTLPKIISFPQLKVFLPGGFVLGLLLGVGLAFLLEFIDDSLKSPRDVVRNLNSPLLGMIPAYDKEEMGEVSVEKISESHPHSLLSEFYRQLRANLALSAPEGELKTMLITGASAECGKTTTAINLGITYAHEDKRVLLVDVNFRRPTLGKLLAPADSELGLSNLLVGQAEEGEIIHPSGIKNLDVVSSGPLPPNPAHLLSSVRMRSFIEEQKENYDCIIFDGPPSLLVVDAKILASQMDGTILVFHSDMTTKGVAQRTIRELNPEKVRIMGVILNAVKPRKGGYFEKVYQSYYEYSEKKV